MIWKELKRARSLTRPTICMSCRLGNEPRLSCAWQAIGSIVWMLLCRRSVQILCKSAGEILSFIYCKCSTVTISISVAYHSRTSVTSRVYKYMQITSVNLKFILNIRSTRIMHTLMHISIRKTREIMMLYIVTWIKSLCFYEETLHERVEVVK